MGRPRNPKRNEAMRIYLESGGLKSPKELAELLKAPAQQIRKWKSEDKWDEELKKPIGERNIPKRKTGPPYGSKNALGNKGGKGGPVGNKNAVGHGAPKRNKNSLQTGEYETIWEDTLTEEERKRMAMAKLDPVANLAESIMLLEIREHRMMDRIRVMQQNPEILAEKRRTARQDGNGNVEFKEQTETIKPLMDRLCATEEALTRVTEKKMRAIEARHRIMKEMGLYSMGTEMGYQNILSGMSEEELRNLAKQAEK